MEQVGVEAVVNGLSAFQSQIGKINSSLDSVRSHGTLLQRAFGTIGDALSAFGSHVVRIAEYALGKLLADAVQWVTRVISDLIQTTIEAGAEFQILELRLERLNFNSLVESGMNYNDAAKEAVELTKEQLTWIQKLAAATPYDAQDVANVYTLARSYSFSATAAQGLTETIMDFAAGMGLGSTEIQRIIVNLGQMVQQGKVTGREMTDLARGAFVPVNDILKRMQENTGLTGGAFEEFRNTGEGVNAFMEAFTQIVEERFQGASERMAQTFKGATDNVKDLVKSMVGMNVVKPILDAIGEKVSSFVSKFTDSEERWNQLVDATTRIGNALVDIINRVFFNMLPSSTQLVNDIVESFEGMADWLENNKGKISDFFINIGKTIKDDLVPFIVDKLIPAIGDFIGWIIDNKDEMLNTLERIGTFISEYIVKTIERISDWVEANRPLIDSFFKSLGEIIVNVIENLTGENVEGGTDFLGSILSILQSIMTFVTNNEDTIAKFITWWIEMKINLEILGVIFNGLIGIVMKVIAVVGTLAAIFAFISNPIGLLIAAIAALLYLLAAFGPQLGEILAQLWFIIKYYANKWWESIKEFVANIWQSLSDGWKNLVDTVKGFFEEIRQGAVDGWNKIKDSFSEAWENIKQTASDTWNALVDGWTNFWEQIGTTLDQLWFIIKYYFNKSWDSIKEAVSNWWNSVKESASSIWQTISDWFGKIKDTISQKLKDAGDSIRSINWSDIGKNIIDGMVSGVLNGAASLISALVGVAIAAYQAAKDALDMNSPSRLFMEVGELTMEGMAIGIRKAAGLAANAMGDAMAQVALPAVALPSVAAGASAPTQVYNSTRNYNLSINTSAASEPIIQDFNMLESLGA